jgi:protein tyrosine/serine phosphatase
MTLFETIRAFRADQGRRAKLRWGEPIATPGRRVWAWASLLLADHGVVRPIYWNFAEVTPALWRGPQPNPLHLERLARRGLKTVVNLRGPSGFGSYALEREACGRLGLAFEDAVLWSRSAPRPEQIGALDALYGRIAYPALVHCKSGADRAGLAAALYLLLREDAPLDRAVDQLSLRFGHVKAAKTGVLDAFFDAYRAARDATGVGFRTWLAESYDPLAVERDFHSTAWGDVLVDRILRRE